MSPGPPKGERDGTGGEGYALKEVNFTWVAFPQTREGVDMAVSVGPRLAELRLHTHGLSNTQTTYGRGRMALEEKRDAHQRWEGAGGRGAIAAARTPHSAVSVCALRRV